MEYVGNILYDAKILHGNRMMAIFGAGFWGRKVLHYVDINGLRDRIVCFCVSEDKLDTQYVDGIPVYSIKDVVKKYSDIDYLISGKYSKEMYYTLSQRGIDRIHLLFF